MKKLLIFLVIITLIFTASACGSKSQEAEQSMGEKEGANEAVIEDDDKENLETVIDDTQLEEDALEDNKDKPNEDGLVEEPETKIKAWDFTLEDLEGKEISLSDYLGKKVLLAFWEVPSEDSLWEDRRPLYEEQFAEFEKLNEEIKNNDLVILTVVTNNNDNKFKEFMSENNYSFITLIDDTDYGIGYRHYGLMTILEIVLIDADGYETYVGNASTTKGIVDLETLKQIIVEVE